MMERPGADSEEKHEPVSDIDTVPVDSLKALDPNRLIREADMCGRQSAPGSLTSDRLDLENFAGHNHQTNNERLDARQIPRSTSRALPLFRKYMPSSGRLVSCAA